MPPAVASTSAEPAKEPAKQRSRSGCETCRIRKKKCDETYKGGSCGRCEAAGYVCTPRLPKARRHFDPMASSSARRSSPVASTSTLRPDPPAPPVPLAPPAPPAPLAPPVPPATSTSSVVTPSAWPSTDFSLSPFFGSADMMGFDPSSPGGRGDQMTDAAADMGLWMAQQAMQSSVLASAVRFPKEPEVAEVDFYSQHVAGLWFLPNIQDVAATIQRWATRSQLSAASSRAASAAYKSLQLKQTHTRILPDSPDPLGSEHSNDAAVVTMRAASQFYSDALQLFKSPTSVDADSLPEQLQSVMDLQLYHFASTSAKASYAVLAIGDSLVHAVYGMSLVFDVKTLERRENVALRQFLLADLSRCLAIPGRKPIYDLVANTNYSSPASVRSSSSVEDEDLDEVPYLVLPLLLAKYFLDIVKLSLAQTQPADLAAQAAALESAIRAYAPPAFSLPTLASDSAARVRSFAAVEVWRHGAILLLHQLIHSTGPLHPTVQDSRTQIIQLTSHVIDPHQRPSTEVSIGGLHAFPLFLAATMSITPPDREACMLRLRETGPERVFEDNRTFVQACWDESDSTGWPVDWRAVARRDGKVLAFF